MKLCLIFCIFLTLLSSQQRDLKKLENLTNNIFFKTKPLYLEMIFNNKAKINQKWYEKGDVVENFFIKEISMHSVLLQDLQGSFLYLGFKK